jgi:hypothetical protein
MKQSTLNRPLGRGRGRGPNVINSKNGAEKCLEARVTKNTRGAVTFYCYAIPRCATFCLGRNYAETTDIEKWLHHEII